MIRTDTTWSTPSFTKPRRWRMAEISEKVRNSAWVDPRFWVQIGVLVGGLLTIYFTDRSSDQAQVATLSATASQLAISQGKIEGQVTSISNSVNQLGTNVTGLQKDIESLQREVTGLKEDKKTQQVYIDAANVKIARLEARAGL